MIKNRHLGFKKKIANYQNTGFVLNLTAIPITPSIKKFGGYLDFVIFCI